MLKVFAKYGTDEKALVMCRRDQIGQIMERLSKKYDGSWIYVDSINLNDEIIHLTDGLKYLGYTPNQERYCSVIDTLS